MRVAVKMRTEQHAFISHLAQRIEAKDLKTAGVGQDRAGPCHEFVEAAEAFDAFMAGT